MVRGAGEWYGEGAGLIPGQGAVDHVSSCRNRCLNVLQHRLIAATRPQPLPTPPHPPALRMTLMQQRKREAYMELLSNLISSKYEAAKQRLAAVTIQVRRL